MKELQNSRVSFLRAKFFQFCVHSVQTAGKTQLEHKGFLTFVELPSSNKTTLSASNPQAAMMKQEVESANQLILNFGELANALLIKDPDIHAENTRLNAKLAPFLGQNSKLFIFFHISPLLQDFNWTIATLRFAKLLYGKSPPQDSQSRPPSRVPVAPDYNSYPPHQHYESQQSYGDRQPQHYMQQDRSYSQQRRTHNPQPQQQAYQRGQHFHTGYADRHARPANEPRDYYPSPAPNNQSQSFRAEHSGSASAQKKNPNQGYSASRRSANLNSDSFDGMVIEDLPEQPSADGASLKFPGESADMKKNPQEDGFNRSFDSNKMNLEAIEAASMSPGQYNRAGLPDRNPPIQQMSYQQRFSQESSGQQSRQQFSQYSQPQQPSYRDSQASHQQAGQSYSSQQVGQPYLQNQGYQNRRTDGQAPYNKFGGGRPQAGPQGGSQYRQQSQMGGQPQAARQGYQNQYDSQRATGYNQQPSNQSFGGKPSQYLGSSQPQRNRSQGPGSLPYGRQSGQDSFQAAAQQDHGQFEGQQRSQPQAMAYFNSYAAESPTNQGRLQSNPKPQGYSNEKTQTNQDTPSPRAQPHQLQGLAGSQQMPGKHPPQQSSQQRPDQAYFGKQNQVQQAYGAAGYQAGHQRTGSYDSYGGQPYAGGQSQGGYSRGQNPNSQSGGNRYQNPPNYNQKPQHGYGNQRPFHPNK